MLGKLLFCNKMHSYKVLCHFWCLPIGCCKSAKQFVNYANKVLIRSGHANGGLGEVIKINGQIRGYGSPMA